MHKLLISRENNIMREFSFWKTAPPQTTNGIYELRKYNLKPGNLLEWEYYWYSLYAMINYVGKVY
jgi:hypothetical protein